jgi:hypothetical protein
MIIADFPNHPDPMYVSQPTYAVSPKVVKDTIYMPSSIAARVLGGKGERGPVQISSRSAVAGPFTTWPSASKREP